MSNKRKPMLRYIIAGLVIAGVGTGLIAPRWAAIRAVRAEISKLEADLGIQRGRTDGLSALAMRVETLRERVESHNKVVPERVELAQLLRELNRRIEAEDLTSQGISTGRMEAGVETTALPLELTLSGDGPAIFRFIDRVESMPRVIQIDFLELKRDFNARGRSGSDDKNRNNAPPVQGEVRMSAFYRHGAGGAS